MEEPPYINLAPPDPVTGKCAMERGVLCRVASDVDITEWVYIIYIEQVFYDEGCMRRNRDMSNILLFRKQFARPPCFLREK